MKNVRVYFKGHARSDIAKTRRYTIKAWGEDQWIKYKKALFNKLQDLANTPKQGMEIEEISKNAYRFPLKEHVVYYLKRESDVVFVGVLSNSLSPKKHLQRQLDLRNELKP